MRLEDKRTLKRFQLFLYLRVFDDAGKLLGHVVDIHTDGIMLISEQPLPPNQEFNIYLEVPEEDGSHSSIEMTVRSLWCSRDVNPDFYDTGLRIVQASQRAINVIGDMIHEIGFNG